MSVNLDILTLKLIVTFIAGIVTCLNDCCGMGDDLSTNWQQ